MQTEEYITKTQLKERGWTDSIIEKMNLEPDYANQKSLMFSLIKVKRLEKTRKFQNLLQKSQVRKEGAKKAVETKIGKLIEYVDNVEIEIKYMSDRYITKNAIDSYNYWNRFTDKRASLYSDEHFLNRIKMNYIRHELTNYDEILYEIKGKVGKDKAYFLIKKRIQNRIDNELREVFYNKDNFTIK